MTIRYLVSGVVQGVGFRFFVLRRAQALGLGGWVRNLPDGRVEVCASGAPDALASLEAELLRGPRHAEVSRVDKSEISDEVGANKIFEIK